MSVTLLTEHVPPSAAPVSLLTEAKPRRRPEFPHYPAGTWRPPAADALVRRDGRRWRST